MKKPQIKLIAPHYFYWVHLLISLAFVYYLFFILKIPTIIKPLPLICMLLIITASNYYSIFSPLMATDDVEFSPTIFLETTMFVYLLINGYYFMYFVFSLINGQLWIHFYGREYQKIYLNGVFSVAICGIQFLMFDFMDLNLSSDFFILTIKSITIPILMIISEHILSGGFYAKENSKPYFLSSYNNLKHYFDAYVNCMLPLIICYILIKYSPLILLTLITYGILGNEVLKSSLGIRDSQQESLDLLTKTLEAKDPYTAGHSKRVQKYAIFSAAKMHMMPWRISRLQDAALLHDIGKLVVPNEILNKPGQLTDAEYRKMKEHEEVTSKLIRMISFLRPVALFTSPEELYPFEENPKEVIEPQIIYVCDAYDAMTSSRSYRRALTQETAIKELYANAGEPEEKKQFNKKAVDALIKYLKKSKEKHGLGYEEKNFHESAPVVGTGSAGLGDLQKELREEVEQELSEQDEHPDAKTNTDAETEAELESQPESESKVEAKAKASTKPKSKNKQKKSTQEIKPKNKK